MPIYRHDGLRILVQYEGGTRGVGLQDFEKLGPRNAYRAWWDIFGPEGSGAVPVLDKVHFEDCLGQEPAYPNFEAYLEATTADKVPVTKEDYTRWREEWGRVTMGDTQWFGPKVRYGEKVYHLQEESGFPWQRQGRMRRILDPDTKEERTVPWKALVYLEENASAQVLIEGRVCAAEPEPWSTGVTKPDGTTIHVERVGRVLVADKPFGTPVLFEGRVCHLKWTTRPYALVYDPKIGADRKVLLKSLRDDANCTPKPE